jgi:GH25 family lysozyme M1 (1,4-beta-N-acetylmuramidase)
MKKLIAVASLFSLLGCRNVVGDEGGVMGAGDVLWSTESAMTSKCAAEGTVKGIDVSYYQGTIDWADVKRDGVKYAFIRVSDGTGFYDSKFERNWREARAKGVMRGVYQFFRSDEDAIAQADLLIDAVGGALAEGDLPPVIDVESTDGRSASQIAAKVRQWSNRIEDKLGVKPFIYTGPYFWRDNVNGADMNDHKLWVAHYGTSCPLVPPTWTRWTFHQHTSSGRVDGIAGNVDMNRFNGSLADLQALTVPAPFATRAQAMRALGHALDMPTSGHPDAFTDDNTHALEKWLDAAHAYGVLLGNDGRANPNGAVTRAQLAVFLKRIFLLPPAGRDYFDDDDGDSTEDAHNRVAAAGFMVGYGDANGGRRDFRPAVKATPGTLQTLSQRAIQSGRVPTWKIPQACKDGSFEGHFCDDEGRGGVHADRLHDELDVTLDCGELAGEPAFCPAQTATRAEVVYVLTQAAGISVGAAPDGFADDDGHSYEAWLDAAKQHGVITGYTGGTQARPDVLATRDTLAYVLARMYALPATNVDAFSDDDGDAAEAVHNKVAAAGLFVGYDDGRGGKEFRGAKKATRQALATVASRAADRVALEPVWAP